jgi:predicted nucleotidyltransferase
MMHTSGMDLSRPHRIIETGTDAEVLRVLAGTLAPLSGRQVARLARDGSPATVNRSLSRLAETGVLDVAEAGRALMYSLNRDHLAAPALEQLSSMSTRLIDALRAAVAALDPPPVNATLFGSAARGDGDRGSDIDLLLVRDAHLPEGPWQEQLSDLSRRIGRMTGNSASIHEVSREDLTRLAEDRPAIVEELERDFVTLRGESIADLLAASPIA